MTPAASTSKVSKTARPSWSCVSCTKKKIKCDKIIPCGSCVRRGVANECRLADNEVSLPRPENPHEPKRMASQSEFDALRQSLASVRARVFHIETALSAFVPSEGPDGENVYSYKPEEAAQIDNAVKMSEVKQGKSVANSPDGEGPSRAQSRRASSDVASEVEAAVTLEFLALGRDQKTDHFNRGLVRRQDDLLSVDSPHQSESLFAHTFSGPSHSPATPYELPPPASAAPSPNATDNFSLPSQPISDAIIRFTFSQMSYRMSFIHPPTFWEECAEFFGFGDQKGTLVNQAWLAVYWAVLCSGVKHMSSNDAIMCGLGYDAPAVLPQQFFDASVAALYRANFLAKHSIFSVQAIIILVYSASDLGGSDFSAMLLSSAIRISQHLMIHRFPSDEVWDEQRRKKGIEPSSPEGVKALVTREIRKRMWIALITDDYLGCAYRRPYTIVPGHYSTPLPLNCTDEDLATGQLINRSLEQPTSVVKNIVVLKLSECVRRFFEGVSVDGLSIELCRRVDRDMAAVIADGPSYIRPGTNISSLPSWVPSLRRYFIATVNHKRLLIQRSMVAHSSFPEADRTLARATMVDCAKQILHVFNDTSEQFQEMWTTAYHAVVASVTIMLELFRHNPSEHMDLILAGRQLVEGALMKLSTLTNYSTIAGRGVQLLQNLLAEENSRRMANPALKRKLEDETLPLPPVAAKRPATSSTLAYASPHHNVEPYNPNSAGHLFDLNEINGTGSGDTLDWILTNTNPIPDAPVQWFSGNVEGQQDFQVDSLDFWKMMG